MKILWVTNTLFPAVCEAMGLPVPLFGGWMHSLAESLGATPGVQLAIATVYPKSGYKKLDRQGITYFLLPAKPTTRYYEHLEQQWKLVHAEFNPDIVHIHGTELTHGLALMRAIPNLNFIVSIQGLVSVIAKYYFAGMTPVQVAKNITLRDILKWDTIHLQRNKFKKRGEFEREMIRKTNHVIGRTTWDRAHVNAIHPGVRYHFCNECLRDVFLSAPKWSRENCTQYSIFLSQAYYPLKGMHQVLKAVAILKNSVPGIQVRVAGLSIIGSGKMTDRLKLTGYGSFIRSLIDSLELGSNVRFLGALTDREMTREYNNCHVFVCPSSMENSSNSVGEAQLLGTPVVCSYVGGIPDMVQHEKTGLLYQFEEVEMLAEQISRIFRSDALAGQLSTNAIEAAEKRHDPITNVSQTMAIYKEIAGAAL